ncbi:MAG: competence/damage-inducible protein A [Dehalococcoidia bacterium]|nr:MAG: competence/damage-inducible protein A [Dehalococcoidia bacterium]
MRAEIISVGTELLLGELTDTNAPFLASQLPLLGIDLYWISQVGDNQVRLVEVLKRAWQRSDLILITGGLGPTEDDLTREAIAELLEEKLKVVPALERELRELFARRRIEMPPTNIKQATLIPSAEVIDNVNGTAPGWWVEKDKRIIIAMPGPPREMQPMWYHQILPRLRQTVTGAIIVSKTFKTFGLTEASVGELVSPLLSSANPTLGVYAKADGIHLRLTAKAQSQRQAEEMIAHGEAKLRSILGEYIWGTDDDTLEAVIGHMLTEKGLSLAVMESYPGGLLAATITSAPGASTYFKGGLVASSDEALRACGIDAKVISDYGSSSAAVAQAMAEAARLHLGTDIGVGIAGVDESNEVEERLVTTIYIGIDDGKDKRAITAHYPPWDRAWVKRRAVTAALFWLRKILATA